MDKSPIFDVSGVNGAAGISGTSFGLTMASTGSDGRRGGDGTDGQCGSDAGTIAVQLTTPRTANFPKNVVLPNPTDADVKLDASIVSAAGQLQKMDTILKIDSGGSIRFLAPGGHGGHGGHGGNSEQGGEGFRYAFSPSMNPFLNTLGEQGAGSN